MLTNGQVFSVLKSSREYITITPLHGISLKISQGVWLKEKKLSLKKIHCFHPFQGAVAAFCAPTLYSKYIKKMTSIRKVENMA